MNANVKGLTYNLGIFVMGVVFTFVFISPLKFIYGFVFGFEICSHSSFPMEHMAKVRTRPGMGDQTLFLEVDDKDVWQLGDVPGGDLEEELTWDATGKVVTLELQKQPFIRYDTEIKSFVDIENKEPLRLK